MAENKSNESNDQPTLPIPSSKSSLEDSHPSGISAKDMIFGEYELKAEIGRGGMGVVYQAVQKNLNRVVALKMILTGRLASSEDLQRFRTEAEAAARLRHPNIVTVHEVGDVDGHHYFSMEFISGKTLAHHLNSGPIPGRKAARYLQIVAKALFYAHSQGILHRDLKPTNILVDENDQPLITDFGLAKRIGGDASQHTQSGAVLGTPSYMSPEQAGGRIKDIGPACDIYGLGAVLYELLTGKPPFRSESQFNTLIDVIHNEPVPPRLINPRIDVDLETICLKCLEKDPKNRYATAEELEQDLKRYLQGDSIHARSSNVLDRLTRLLDRSQHDAAFHTWSTMLFIIAGIVVFEHILIFFLTITRQPSSFLMAARLSQFCILGLVFLYNRGNQLTPRTAAERELWSIWIGYFISYCAGLVMVKSLVSVGILTAGPNAPTYWENLVLYPVSSLLSGLAFFIMGSNYWGRCYAIGIAFLGMAIITTLHIEWAPLEFGLLWGFALTSVGLRLRKLSGKDKEEIPDLHAEPTVALENQGKSTDGTRLQETQWPKKIRESGPPGGNN